MRILRRATVLAALAAALSTAGCFDLEESVELDKNLSGKAGLQCTVDMGAMVLPMLMMKRQMEGKTGEPTAAEIAQARKEMIAQQKTQKSESSGPPKREEIEKSLPPGVHLLEAGVDDKQDLKLRDAAAHGSSATRAGAAQSDPRPPATRGRPSLQRRQLAPPRS